MTEEAVISYITGAFAGVETQTVGGDTFFFHDAERKFPFATVVTSNANDGFSDLDRPGVFRLNLGVGKETFRALFGPHPRLLDMAGNGETDYDFTTLDRLLPHPVYGQLRWVCILNPSEETFETAVRPLIAESHALLSGKRAAAANARATRGN